MATGSLAGKRREGVIVVRYGSLVGWFGERKVP